MARLTFLVAGEDDPSTRFRVGIYLPRWEAAGHRVTVRAWPSGGSMRRRLYGELSRADVVVWLRRLLVPWEVRRLRRAARRLVYEFDDALPYRDTGGGARPSLARIVKFRAAVRAADAVVAGNDYLAGLARRYRARPVAVVPTVVEPAHYPPRETPASTDAPPVIGWIGTRANFPYLETLAGNLALLAARRDFTLRVMAERPPRLAGLDPARVDFVPWRAAEEAAFLQGIDVGLMPVADDAWGRGKCGLKALQYLAAEVPVVASAVGVVPDLVEDCGLLVEPGGDWVAPLETLLVDPERRRRLGRAGRQRVRGNFAAAVHAGGLLRTYLGAPEAGEVDGEAPMTHPEPAS
jgi:glycosyltransferase involved in cell wall biosynthesis